MFGTIMLKLKGTRRDEKGLIHLFFDNPIKTICLAVIYKNSTKVVEILKKEKKNVYLREACINTPPVYTWHVINSVC